MTKEKESNTSSWIKSIIIALIVAFIVREFIFTPVQVLGPSMEPTFEHEDRVVITKIHSIDNFDIVIFDAITEESKYIKRVIGLPGDRVVMENDQLFINDVPFDEPYVEDNKAAVFEGQKLTEDFEVEVPKGYLYVLGDNRRESTDSRVLGFIDEKTVVGEVKLRIHPLNRFGLPK